MSYLVIILNDLQDQLDRAKKNNIKLIINTKNKLSLIISKYFDNRIDLLEYISKINSNPKEIYDFYNSIYMLKYLTTKLINEINKLDNNFYFPDEEDRKEAEKILEFRKWKNFYLSAFAFSAIAFLIFFFTTNKISFEKLEFKDKLILEKDPEYISEYGRTNSFYINLKFINNDRIYEINGENYQHVNHERFKKEIKASDTVSIYHSGNTIYIIEKNNYKYCNLDKTNKHIFNSRLFLITISIISMIIFIIPSLLKRKPKIRFLLLWAIIIAITILIMFIFKIVSINYFNFIDYKYK